MRCGEDRKDLSRFGTFELKAELSTVFCLCFYGLFAFALPAILSGPEKAINTLCAALRRGCAHSRYQCHTDRTAVTFPLWSFRTPPSTHSCERTMRSNELFARNAALTSGPNRQPRPDGGAQRITAAAAESNRIEWATPTNRWHCGHCGVKPRLTNARRGTKRASVNRRCALRPERFKTVADLIGQTIACVVRHTQSLQAASGTCPCWIGAPLQPPE